MYSSVSILLFTAMVVTWLPVCKHAVHVLFAVVLFQFLLTLFTGQTNQRLLKLGQSLGTYIYQIIAYMSFNSDHQPYPFGAWPKGPPAVKKEAIEDK